MLIAQVDATSRVLEYPLDADRLPRDPLEEDLTVGEHTECRVRSGPVSELAGTV